MNSTSSSFASSSPLFLKLNLANDIKDLFFISMTLFMNAIVLIKLFRPTQKGNHQLTDKRKENWQFFQKVFQKVKDFLYFNYFFVKSNVKIVFNIP